MMAMTSPSSFACFALILVFVEGRGRCPPGTYWDNAVGKCDQCSSICDSMEQQGTVKSCQSNCPGYTSSQNVLPNPEKITLIEDKETNPSSGVAIGVSATVFIIISIGIAVFLLRRCRRSGGPVHTTTPHAPEQEPSLSYVDSIIIAQIEDKSKPLISTGHACEDRPEQDHPVHHPDIPTRVTSVSEV
ncbi:uncharacterized protein LOC124152017 [Haliotis rufescens]|uniref:uncharacterized protein LOC124152017 n=1 Tax=Haliotis rufescens TaxID=6454 RepID=UPI00201F7A5C|nr:uncharacterized protein LOC124152017 [Haliotis rufescens]